QKHWKTVSVGSSQVLQHRVTLSSMMVR
ncbi:putative gamma-glutamyl kinase, partial [Vibrio parahaemolyticus V-223/04]